MHYQQLLKQYPIISDQIQAPALGVVLRELEMVINNEVAGDIVELGCYIGTTSLFIQRLLKAAEQTNQTFHSYDSFAGLPPKTSQDASPIGQAFQGGELAVSKKVFLDSFKQAGVPSPITHKAWFKDLTNQDLPQQIAYGFLDGDFYESITDSLKLVWPRLTEQGTITIDDYDREALPGVTKAVNDFFKGKAIKLHHEHHIAIIKKDS